MNCCIYSIKGEKMNIKDKPNKVRARLIVDIEAEFYDNESSEETLRYNYSGNYYVGITEYLEKRMLVHWRRKSRKKGLPRWSFAP